MCAGIEKFTSPPPLLDRPAHPPRPQFSVPVVILFTEALKMMLCLIIISYKERKRDGLLDAIRLEFRKGCCSVMMFAVPGAIYVLSNYCVFLAIERLSPARLSGIARFWELGVWKMRENWPPKACLCHNTWLLRS